MQFLVSNALKNQGFEYTRVNVDVAEYKKQRAQRLSERAEEWMKKVKDSGRSMDLKPMNAADRRTVHKLAQDWGIASESEGEGVNRHIVLKPGSDSDAGDDSNNDTPAAKDATVGICGVRLEFQPFRALLYTASVCSAIRFHEYFAACL
jgi:hypothetical protein